MSHAKTASRDGMTSIKWLVQTVKKPAPEIREALSRAGVSPVYMSRREYWPVEASLAALEAYSSPDLSVAQKVATAIRPPKASAPKPPAAPASPPAIAPEIAALADARARSEIAKARRLEAMAAKMTGELIPLADVEKATGMFTGKLRASLLSVADRLAPRMVGLKSDRAARELIHGEITAALALTADALDEIVETARSV